MMSSLKPVLSVMCGRIGMSHAQRQAGNDDSPIVHGRRACLSILQIVELHIVHIRQLKGSR